MIKGNIEKRGEGTYRLTVHLGFNADGSRNRVRKTISIEDKALLKTTKKLRDYLEMELNIFKQQVLSGNYIAPSKLTFKEFYENEWKVKDAEPRLKRTTFLSHCSKIENHVLPHIGHMKLEEINTMRMVTLFSDLRKPGARIDQRGNKQLLKSRTIQYIFDVTMLIFKTAKEWGAISDNPMSGIKRPQISKSDKKEIKDRKNYYEEDEAVEVIDALIKSKTVWRLYFLGAIIGGFRRGELLALEEDACDFKANRLHISRSISHTENGEAVITDTKNESSDDYVDMPEWYMNELELHIKAMRKLKLIAKSEGTWRGGERHFVFHAGTGKPYYHTTPTQRWKYWCEKNGFRDVSLHGLRHTNATYLLGQGVSLKEIQHRLRHSTSQVTADTYAHVTKKLSRKTTSHLEIFNPKSRPQSVPKSNKNG